MKPSERLNHAIREGDLDALRVALEEGADLNQRNSNGFTPLLSACVRGQQSVCEALLEAGANTELSTPAGDGPVEIALINGQRELATWLEAQGIARRTFIDDAFRARCRARITPRILLESPSPELSSHGAAILAWLEEHPYDGYREARAGLEGEPPELGWWPWPEALLEMLRVSDGDWDIGEYTVLSAAQIAEDWAGTLELFEKGTFDTFRPHADPTGHTHHVWWHPGLIPFARDGGGNAICVDLDPGPEGTPGQVVWWEIRGGPHVDGASSLEAFLEHYAMRLASGDYDEASAFLNAGAWMLTR